MSRIGAYWAYGYCDAQYRMRINNSNMQVNKAMNIKSFLYLPICVLLGGCAGWSQETKQEEASYLVLSVMDGAQTLQGLKHPKCYAEANPPLRGHPGASEVVAWRAFVGISHAGITEFLVKREASPTALRVWEGLGIGAEGKAVVLNWQLGAKPWGARC